MFASGSVIGLAVGGPIIQQYGWQTTFFSIIPFAAGLTIIIWRAVHVDEQRLQQPQDLSEPIKNTEKELKGAGKNEKTLDVIDVKGAIALAATVTSFLLVLTNIAEEPGETLPASPKCNPLSFLSQASFRWFFLY